MLKPLDDITNGAINRAGDCLRNADSSDVSESLNLVNRWRESHYPVLQKATQMIKNLGTPDAIVASRLKRMPSIRSKLLLINGMQLSRMQDIAGCRIVLRDNEVAESVKNSLLKYVENSSEWKCKNKAIDDYVLEPKLDGYRSVHLNLQYFDDSNSQRKWNIEVQIRSRLQHDWATAVEVVAMLTCKDLKRGVGSFKWKRFMLLSSSLFCRIENLPNVENVPDDFTELIVELKELWVDLDVEQRLSVFTESLKLIKADSAPSSIYVLVLDSGSGEFNINRYDESQIEEAWLKQTEMESQFGSNQRFDVVLTRSDSIRQLEAAFPNYFLDTREFLKRISASFDWGFYREFANAFDDFSLCDFDD